MEIEIRWRVTALELMVAEPAGPGTINNRTLVAGALGEGSAGDDSNSSSSEEEVEPGEESSPPAKSVKQLSQLSATVKPRC